MSFLERARDEIGAQASPRTPSSDTDTEQATVTVAGESVPIEAVRRASTTVDGELVDIEEPETVQTGSEGNWLSGTEKYGKPRGFEAFQARQIVQTSAMQAIGNGIVDQLTGGELVAESDTELNGAAADLWTILKDVIRGPHVGGNDLDDLITAAVFDMLGPANAYWQLLGAQDADIPVVSLIPLDALTIRHNVNRHGMPQDPPYYQATGAFTSEGVSTLGEISPTALEDSQLAVMHYPRGARTHRHYPMSPAMQVREWLEILTNSTTHHNRFYSDNEVPPGLLQILGGSSQSVENVKEKIQSAVGDPRSVEVIGGEGQAMWVEMGGTSVNLDVIQEQQWFFQLCLGALGLGKAELGLIEDVNRSNGEIEASRIYKRVASGFLKQFHGAFRHIARQFEPYAELGQPFDPRLRFTDPRQERAREERLRSMYEAGGLTLREYVRRRGDEDLADDPDRFVTEVNGERIDYGDLPKWLAQEQVRAARDAPLDETDEDDAELID